MNKKSILSPHSNLRVAHRQKGFAKSSHLQTSSKSIHRINNIDRLPNKKRVLIPNKTDLLIIDVDDILYAKASGNYTNIYLSNGQKHMVCKTLKAWLAEENIPLIRCHQSYAVNPFHVVSFLGKKQLKLSSDDIIPIARRKYQHIIEHFINPSD